MTARLVGTWGARCADELIPVLHGSGASVCDVLELRLDLPSDGASRARELVLASPKPVLATCRRAGDGGGFAATESARIDVLVRAAEAGARWIDVEDDVTDADVARLATTGAKLLRSRHVGRLGDDADAIVARLLALPGDAAKFVALEGSDADALRMMTFVRDAGGRLAGHVVRVPFTRVASAALGAPFVYAAIQPGGRIGLPMPTATHLCRRAELRRLRAGTPLFVLLGANVEAAVSTDMLNVLFGLEGSGVVAARWSCADPGPPLEAIRRFGWAGAAVTIPHKEAVAALLRDVPGDGLDATAVAAGAVNTVIASAGGLRGANTDVGGLLDALAPHVRAGSAEGRAFAILGAGGAARAAVVATREIGARPVVLARRPDAAAALGADVASDAAALAATSPAVVVNATPSGPPGGVPFFDPALLPGPAVVLDMQVYARPTALLAAAERAGHVVLPGLDMLHAQAVRQVRLLRPDAAAALSDALERGDVSASDDPLARDWCLRLAGALLRRRDAPIVLVGLRCAGKTTAGERLAELLGRPFLDTDREVERRAGRSVEAMLRAGDETVFRAVEASVLRDVIDVPGAVIASGGGAALHRAEFAALAEWGTVVLLDAPDEVLLARRAASPRTPLTSLPPAAELAQQRAARMTVYRSVARLEIDVSSRDAESVACVIAAWWDAQPV